MGEQTKLFWLSTQAQVTKSTKELNREFRATVDEFRQGYMSVQRLAERSRVEYKTDVLKLLFYLQDRGVKQLKSVTSRDISNYLSGLEKNQFAYATIRKKVLVIKLFFSWIKVKNLIPSDPTFSIIPPERIEEKPYYLTQNECRQLVGQVKSIRDKALLQLLIGTGVTLSEIRNLTLSDISDLNVTTRVTPGVFGGSQVTTRAAGTLRIRGKGIKGRVVPLDQSTCEVLIAYLEKRQESTNHSLFPSPHQGPLSGRQIENIVEKYLLKLGIRDANVQTLRHTYAKIQLKKGIEPIKLKELMGYIETRSVLKYLNV